MAIYGKKTRVDTPFDDYKRRSAEPAGVHVGRSKAAPFYMNNRSVIFLVGVVLSLAMKCENIFEFSLWSVVLLLMILFWSFTVRLFVPHKNIMANILVNFLYVVLWGLGYSFLIRYLGSKLPYDMVRLNLELVYDMHYLTPMAISFSSVSRYEEERPDFGWNVLFPAFTGVAVMIVTTLVSMLFHITKGFMAIMEAALLLMLVSVILSAIRKHGVYFAAKTQYDIFTAVPDKDPSEFGKFVLNKLFLFISCGLTVAICEAAVIFLSGKFDIRIVMPALIALILGGFVALISKIPFLGSKDHGPGDIRYLIRYYEYPAISALLSLPFASDYPYIKLAVYIALIILADSLITGLIVALPRRLIFSNRNGNSSGAPAILLTISLIVMVGTVFFVIY